MGVGRRACHSVDRALISAPDFPIRARRVVVPSRGASSVLSVSLSPNPQLFPAPPHPPLLTHSVTLGKLFSSLDLSTLICELKILTHRGFIYAEISGAKRPAGTRELGEPSASGLGSPGQASRCRLSPVTATMGTVSAQETPRHTHTHRCLWVQMRWRARGCAGCAGQGRGTGRGGARGAGGHAGPEPVPGLSLHSCTEAESGSRAGLSTFLSDGPNSSRSGLYRTRLVSVLSSLYYPSNCKNMLTSLPVCQLCQSPQPLRCNKGLL